MPHESRPATPILLVEGLSKTYPNGRGLAEVRLELNGGTIVSLGGPNGSGKSTLLRCVAGLTRYEGTIAVDGRVAGGDPEVRRAIGYLPQTLGLPENATIGEVLDFFARLRGVDPEDSPLPDGFVRDWDERVGPLSVGQRQRVGLAVALLGRPKLLLLDEPVASLDHEGREQFWEVLRDLRETQGTTSLLASPSPFDLLDVADRAISMEDGRITGDEPIPIGMPPDPRGDMDDLDEVGA